MLCGVDVVMLSYLRMLVNKKVDSEFLVHIPFYIKENTRMLKYIEV